MMSVGIGQRTGQVACANMRSLITIIFLFVNCYATNSSEYSKERARILRDESLLSLGGKNILTDKEAAVNNCLMQHKFNEIDYAFDNPQYFNFSRHYFTYKNNIRNSKVYKIIRDMPKGAALHNHDMALLGPDYIMNITYMDHLYVCFENDDLQLRFSNTIPTVTCKNKWQLMSDARRASRNIHNFDAALRKHFTMVVEDPDKEYPTIKETWIVFMNYFKRIAPLLSYRPVWEQYFYDALKRFREDNIMYLEVRSVLPVLYELDGTIYDPLITAKSYGKMINKFVKDYPDFIGAKLIYAPNRKVDRRKLDEYLQLARRIKSALADKFAGFDLVGEEDLGNPLIEFATQLLAAKDLTYFFHAGETNWYGTLTDENLVDAILLGAKRLGHAYALVKHPMLLKAVMERDIALEVNVLSNTVLSLVRDVRNHPLNIFLALGLPVVLASDDPGIWEADPLSDDFYVAFVGVSSRLADLRLLKQLAINSLKYSALDSKAKLDAISRFDTLWNDFINKFDCNAY